MEAEGDGEQAWIISHSPRISGWQHVIDYIEDWPCASTFCPVQGESGDIVISEFVEKICAITPPQRDSPYQDSCLWSGTLTGQFTIDSSYELQNSTYQDAKEKQWRKIWKLEVSERIRHLIWLVQNKGLKTKLYSNLGSPCMDWSAILATACYKIWQWRNQKLHNSGYVFPVMLASDIHLSHGQYKCVMALHKKVVSNSKPRVVARWAPAKEIWLIVNTDSAASSNCIAGCGGLIRNDKGDGLGGFAKYIGNCNALIVEFCGVHEGIRLVKNYSIKNVEFQVDNVEVLKVITSYKLHRKFGLNMVHKIQDDRPQRLTKFSC
ncbi:uncharacterized protein LOC127098491 [Lathyrus oleraceus]|uniref:uncharacterized protein LOC127098491 n=1 Tax=Pisum sativum TaxID=3888 RepID=UPI0021D043AB|nr:uncharacterized protein LOC127098491 [Pisum sativum]